MTRQKKTKGLGSKNKRGGRKRESNERPEIPDGRETSDIPGLPWGGASGAGQHGNARFYAMEKNIYKAPTPNTNPNDKIRNTGVDKSAQK